MKNATKKKSIKNEHLETEDKITYYLSNIDNEEVMEDLRWISPNLFLKIMRLSYINTFRNKEPISTCPECHEKTILLDDGEEYCEKCGLVTRNNYPYTAGFKHYLEYGVRL